MDQQALFGYTVLSAVGLILEYIFTGLAAQGIGPFNLTISEVSAKYETDIVPASYTFLIWNVIFVWQGAWMAYAVISLFRKNAFGPVYLNPIVLPASFHLSWIISCGFFIGWCYAWCNERLFTAFIALLLFLGCGYAASAFQAIATSNNLDKLKKESRKELIAIYVLVQNGTDILFAWSTVAALLNLSMALTYDPIFKGSVSSQTACLISLSILLLLVVSWSVLENTSFFKFFSFIYTWYAVLLWASIGILVKNHDLSNTSTILTIVILAVTTVCLGIKIAVYLVKTKAKGKIEYGDKVALTM